MRYKDLTIRKLEQLENQLNGLKASFANPKLTIQDIQEHIDKTKERVEEIKTLVNADQQD